MRPIDGDYISDALEAELCREGDDLEDRQWAYGYAAGVSFAVRKLAEAPTLTPPNEWVSVEERLPGSQEDVLVVAFWHECWQTMIGWHSDAGKKWRVITPHGEREPGGVSHWMPIPAPPDRRPPEGEEDTQ